MMMQGESLRPRIYKEIPTKMKKFMSVMLGLSLVLGAATVAFADDAKPAGEKKMKKKGGKKKAEDKKEEKK
jgi:hypothetical protein